MSKDSNKDSNKDFRVMMFNYEFKFIKDDLDSAWYTINTCLSTYGRSTKIKDIYRSGPTTYELYEDDSDVIVVNGNTRISDFFESIIKNNPEFLI